MALRKKLCERSNFNGKIMDIFARYYSSKMDLRKLKPMIQRRIQNRAKDYPVPTMVPVAQEVLDSRRLVMQVEAFHLKHMFQDVIKHHQRFDFERVPAVVELCWQAGANDGNYLNWNSENDCVGVDGAESLSSDELILVASGTLRAWEILRSGVEKLLMVYPAKVCKHCSEVHVGPSGHKARLCGIFKYESWQGTHFWRKANVDDLVPPKTVWRRRPQDPQVLLNEGRGFYGHAPGVVELCTQAGAIAPPKYHCMMKLQGTVPRCRLKLKLPAQNQLPLLIDCARVFSFTRMLVASSKLEAVCITRQGLALRIRGPRRAFEVGP
ncbi:hypothetical protein DVH24_036244 [Malus domestica]|uniref:APO domain-containing protein n=1 Tax=Malus domestica TaxID=3750 RepID=A0A498IL08_MALDO|nr:hypothetical protein DVH24_036244 [Malus domestica]